MSVFFFCVGGMWVGERGKREGMIGPDWRG